MPSLCRDCLKAVDRDPPPARCPACGSGRVLSHPELDALAIAHIDCDAFYAAVEKRDDPSIRGRPVIVGGGRRGVVAACCYIARIDGVRSAMPMYKAKELCPDAVVIHPNLEKYRAVGRQVRAMMEATTPLVEPISIDEAFLDLSGTETLHGGSPARTLNRLAFQIEKEIGVTVSVGLSFNKFLAKIASDLNKPRGFAVIGRAEALDFLAPRPVGTIWGAGRALVKTLEKDGIGTIAQLRTLDETTLVRRYGVIGRRLYAFARGEDFRRVDPVSETKSISAETTFETDVSDAESLKRDLWHLAETVAGRLKRAGLAGGAVTLKLKTADFRLLTRSRQLSGPSQMADEIFRHAAGLLEAEADGRRFRLIGVGVGKLGPADGADAPDLLDVGKTRRAGVERAMDRVREKFGRAAIAKGRGWRESS